MKLKKNKKGQGAIGIIIFFGIILLILVVGLVASFLLSTVDIVSDEVTPIMTSLGVVNGANISEASEYTFGVVDGFVQSLPWIIGLAYVLALVFTLVFIFVSGFSPHPAFIGFYFVLMILLIFSCVLISNVYQDVYTGDDEIASRLKEQTILSYMILYSPGIMFTFALVGGILMFIRKSDSEYSGGYGV